MINAYKCIKILAMLPTTRKNVTSFFQLFGISSKYINFCLPITSSKYFEHPYKTFFQGIPFEKSKKEQNRVLFLGIINPHVHFA